MSLWGNIGSFLARATAPAQQAASEDEAIVKSMQQPQSDPMVDKFDALLDKQTDEGRT